jgi:hypothetical protein
MPELRLNSTQSESFAAWGSAFRAEVRELARKAAADHGEDCEVFDNAGALLYTAEPPEYCRACCENPRATDSNDPRYCWPCLLYFADSYSLHRVAPLED